MPIENEQPPIQTGMEKLRKVTKEITELERDPNNALKIKDKLQEALSLVSKLANPNEKDFIISELKKKGYPLESYVQWLLANEGWHIHPNIYFEDKDTNNGRELDITAWKSCLVSTPSNFNLNLFCQCKKILGNAWIFFSVPQNSVATTVQKSMLADIFGCDNIVSALFSEEDTHFTSSDILATNYCEIILDRDNKKDNRDKSNQREDNIFSSVMTLIKATHLEVEENNAFLKKGNKSS